jgi:hypothetical protein
MADDNSGLKREEEPLRPTRARRERADAEPEGRRARRDGWRREADGEEEAQPRRRRRRERGRPPLRDEFQDLNRGAALTVAESVALTLNIVSRVLQGAVDRAFDEDYSEPGDLLRGVAREADQVGYDLVDELRRVPRQLDRTFEQSLRSPRAERGERARRRDDDD